MKDLNKYVDRCIEKILEYDGKWNAIDDMALMNRAHFALGYMDDSKEVKKLLWAICYGEKFVEEN